MPGPDKRAREDDEASIVPPPPMPPRARRRNHNSALLALMARRVYTGGWLHRVRPLLDCLPPEDVRALAAVFVGDPSTLLDVAWIVAKNGYAANVCRCSGICREMWRWIAPELSEADAARARRDHLFWQAIIDLPHGAHRRTRLMQATARGALAHVETLIAWHADVNAADKDGDTALILASGVGYVEVVRALLAAGAGVDVATNNGWTALICASFDGQVETVRELLAMGADKHVITNNGDTAYSCAAHIPASTAAIRALLALAP